MVGSSQSDCYEIFFFRLMSQNVIDTFDINTENCNKLAIKPNDDFDRRTVFCLRDCVVVCVSDAQGDGVRGVMSRRNGTYRDYLRGTREVAAEYFGISVIKASETIF